MSEQDGPWRRRLAGVLIATALLRILAASFADHVSPDGVELLDMARHLRAEGAPLLSVKAYHYHATPVVHYGGYERPLLPAAMFAGVGATLEAAQWLNVALSLLVVLLIFRVAAVVYGRRAALVVALLVGLAPPLLIISSYPLSETMSVLAVAGILAVVASRRRSALVELSAGLAVGLAAAVRPVNLVAAVPLGCWLLATRRTASLRARALVLLAAGPILFLVVNGWVNRAHGASFWTLPQDFLFRVKHYWDGMVSWPAPTLPDSAFTFLGDHLGWVVNRVVKRLVSYGSVLLFDPRFLFVWWMALPLVVLRAVKRQLHPVSAVALGIALAHLLVHAGTWSTYDEDRFLLVPLTLLLAVTVGEALTAWRAVRLPLPGRHGLSLVKLLVCGTLLVHGALSAHHAYSAYRAAGKSPFVSYSGGGLWRDPDLPRLMEQLDAALEPDAVVACSFPWEVTHLTSRPSVFLPHDLDRVRFDDFARTYHAVAVVLDPKRDASHRSFRVLTEAAPGGWTSTVLLDRFVFLCR
jgi:hypothetical protein